jgi:phosphate-selective porin OprO and OprP
MRHSALATVLAATLGLSFTAAAAEGRDAEIALLKEQLALLQAQVQALEERTDAQSDVNIDTAQALDKLANDSVKAETRGGIKVSTPDKVFEASLGGRIHFDAYAFDRDLAPTTGTTEFRRARLTLAGKLYGWDYKMEQDFAAGTNLDGLRDLYIAKGALGGKFTIGHFKPYRSMEELTSSNEITMMERPFSSATGLYAGRQFQQGVGYLRGGGNYTFGIAAFNLRGAGDARNEGTGASLRATYAPLNTDSSTLHLGVSASTENANRDSVDLRARANYAGRRGPSQTMATTTGASGDSVDTIGIEAAGAFGPLFFQSEYARASFGRPEGGDHDVETWYVMGSWMLNGGHKPYKAASGVFAAPKATGKGLWELTARYDTIENKDVVGLEVASLILGLNYYINPNVRVMFNYTRGDNELTGDETGQYGVRTQLSF